MTQQPIDLDFDEDPGPDDIGYSNPYIWICTDPGCPGDCGGVNHHE